MILRAKCKASRRGFTLFEIGVTLSIMGLVVMGAVTAKSNIDLRQRTNQVGDQLATISNNMRAVYAARNVTNITSVPVTVDIPGFTSTMISQNVAPSEMVSLASGISSVTQCNTTTAVCKMYSPWSSPVTLYIPNPVFSGDQATFSVQYDNVSAEYCSKLIVANSLPGPTTGIKDIKLIDKTSASTVLANKNHQLPVKPTDTGTLCDPSKQPYKIVWYYGFTQSCDIGRAC